MTTISEYLEVEEALRGVGKVERADELSGFRVTLEQEGGGFEAGVEYATTMSELNAELASRGWEHVDLDDVKVEEIEFGL